MKRIVIGGVLMMFTLTAFSQQSAVDRVFDKYSGQEGYTTVYISSFMFNLLNSLEVDDPEYNEFKKATSGINSIKILTQDGGGSASFGSELLKMLPRRSKKSAQSESSQDIFRRSILLGIIM